MSAAPARRAAAVAAAAALAAAGAAAQGPGIPLRTPDEPIEIAADGSLEWNREDRSYVARGNAKAVQGDVTLRADVLTARYRRTEEGGTAIWRIEADRDVRLSTPAQKASGAKGIYHVDRGVFVLTGPARLDTETDRITARDSLEYQENERLAIARGDVVATRGENRLGADVLTARIATGTDGKARVRLIDAAGNVVITTPDSVARADRAAYDVETGIAKLDGSVRLTRGENQLNGDHAEVDLNAGTSRLVSRGGRAVRGLFVPGSAPLRGPARAGGG